MFRPRILSTSIALLLAGATALPAATIYWTGDQDGNFGTLNAGNSNWATDVAGTTDYTLAVQAGDALNFAAAGIGASALTINNDQIGLSIASLTFLPAGGSLAGPLTLSGQALTLTGGLTNNNTTAGRNVTIGNNLAISGAQNWSTVNNSSAITILNGNLSGTGAITITAANTSNGNGNLPALRFGGNNSGYTGTITFSANDVGIMLLAPQAQTGGLLDLNGANRNLWLASNTVATPYTFHTGNTTPGAGQPMAVNFRNAGTSGIYLTGGDVFWNPTTTGNDYEWDATRFGTHGEIRINGSNDTSAATPVPMQNAFLPTPRMLFFGNANGTLVLGGNRAIHNGTGGINPARITLNFALSDDGTARQFTTSAGLLVLTRATDARGGAANLGGVTRVTGGALAISNMNQVFKGWLELAGGVAMLDGVSWAQFMTDRSAGYRASAGADAWGITNASGGFAARGSEVNIFINADPTASYGTITAGAVFNRDFALGSAARAADNSLYANARVVISQDTVLTAARTIRLNGGNRENLSNWTIDGPVHEFSGAITGAFALTIGGNSITGGGTLRLSNPANAFSSLAVNPSGLGGGAVVIATDDLVLGPGTVTVGSGAQGQAGLLLFENQTGTPKTFAKALTIAMGADASSGDSGFGSWAGEVLYTGNVTITGSRTTLPVQVQGGKFTFGAGSALTNDSTGTTQTYSKGGAGELVLDANTTYAGTNPNLFWALRQGTLTTAAAGKLINGTGTFDGDFIFGHDTVTWPSATGSLALFEPVTRTWKVTTVDQSYTSAAMAYAGYTTIEVETGRTLTISTGANATSPSEARGNGNTTPRWDLIKAGGGTWVFSNTDLTAPAASGPQNGGGFIRVDAGVLDLTGDYGRGSLTLNGGTILSGTFSPFTYGTSTLPFTLGVTQTNLFEITSAGGKLGISGSATGNVSRAGGINAWDQSVPSTVTLASRDNFNLVFANAAFPDVAAPTTLAIERDGSGTGLVQINDTNVTVSGTLAGQAALRLGSAGTGTLQIAGTFAPGPGPATFELEAALTFGPGSILAAQIGGNTPGDGAAFYDQINVTNATGSVTLDSTATLSLAVVNGYVPMSGDVFYILTRADAGAFSTTFAGAPEGGTVSLAGGYSATITYLADWTGTQAGSALTGGNDVALYNVIPEPSAAALLLGSLGLLATRRRR
jgi:hypothetical protein